MQRLLLKGAPHSSPQRQRGLQVSSTPAGIWGLLVGPPQASLRGLTQRRFAAGLRQQRLWLPPVLPQLLAMSLLQMLGWGLELHSTRLPAQLLRLLQSPAHLVPWLWVQAEWVPLAVVLLGQLAAHLLPWLQLPPERGPWRCTQARWWRSLKT